jgi:hypothetical protein
MITKEETMKKILAITLLILCLGWVPVGACDNGKDCNADATATATIEKGAIINTLTGGNAAATATATGGAGGSATATGGAGGTASLTDNSKTYNTNTNINAPEAKATIEKGAVTNNNANIGIVAPDIKNVNVNKPTFNNDPTFNNTVDNKNVNVNKNDLTNIQGQKQGQQQGQTQGQGQSQSNKNTNTFTPTNTNSNNQGQSQSSVNRNINTISPVITASPTNSQGQVQTNSFTPTNTQSQSNSIINTPTNIQGQTVNNGQTIAPVQATTFTSPDIITMGAAPGIAGPAELNFISPNERDVQAVLPKFGCGVVRPLTSNDCIIEVLWQANDIKFKDLYGTVLKGLKSDAVRKLQSKSVRYQIREAVSSKTWTTGGSISGNGVGQIGTSVSGVSGGIVPQIGRSKSSNLYTIIFVGVQN